MDYSTSRSWCRAAVLAFALLASLVAISAVQAQTEPAVGATVFSDDVYPRHPTDFADGVTGIPDITYTSRPGYRPLTLDLYLPPSSFNHKGPRPFVVYVHGGGWLTGTPRNTSVFTNWPQALASIAAKGYVVASVRYRLSAEARFPGAILDVKDAVRWMRAHASTYNIDRSRGLIWGASAGGQLAALAATSCGVDSFGHEAEKTGAINPAVEQNKAPPSASESACLQGAVVWYGVSSMRTQDKAGNAYLNCDDDRCAALRKAASPITYITDKVPPFLIIHGADDTTVPAQQSRDLYNAVRAHGGKAELVLIPGVSHSFVGSNPAVTRDAALQAWKRTLAFLDQTIGDSK